MNIQFENRYFASNQMLSEYVHKIICRKLKLAGIIISAVNLALLIFTLHNNGDALSLVLGLCVLTGLLVVIFVPILTLKQFKESNRRIHNDKISQSVIRFGDNISISEGTFSLSIEYSQILKTYILKHSYVLMFGKNNGILVDPKHFTIGNADDFIGFIESKMKYSKQSD